MKLIEAESVSLVYKDGERLVHAVQDVSLDVLPREFIGILGPSGSGKSSLLYLMSGLKLASSGEVRYRGLPYESMGDSERSALRRSRFGFIFQQPYLLGYLTVLENVLVAADNPKVQVDRAMELLETLGVSNKAHRYPSTLSGGERQRVCVARALLMEPDVIFADEPTASLDHMNGFQVMDLLEECRGGGAVVLVTHDPQMLRYAHTVYKLLDGTVERAKSDRELPAAPAWGPESD
jgi:putative ABC transport system ATP-binding protein